MICKMKTKLRPGLMLLTFFIAVANQSIAQSADKSESDNGAIVTSNDTDTLGNNAAMLIPPPEPLKNAGIIYDDDNADDQIKRCAENGLKKVY